MEEILPIKLPIKVLKDENGDAFVPLITFDAIREHEDGQSLVQAVENKLEISNLIAGNQIELSVDGNNVTISNSAKGTQLINNLTTTVAGTGALDAAQGKVLKDSIPEVINNLTTIDSKKALSAHQGYVLAGRSVPVGGATGQVLKKSADDDYSLEWGDAADPNAIVGDGSIMKIVELTYAEYLELEKTNTLADDTEYHISDWNENERTYLKESDILTLIKTNSEFTVPIRCSGSLRATVTDSSKESNIGASHPTSGDAYIYANAEHHGLYSSKWGVIVDVSDSGRFLRGLADRAVQDEHGNNINSYYQPKLYDSGWINFTNFQNGATVWDTNFSPPRYRRIGNVVYLNGLFTAGTTGTVQFTLPAGFRPTSQYESHMVRNGTSHAIIYINQGAVNGMLAIQNSTAGLETSLNGISYITNDAIPG